MAVLVVRVNEVFFSRTIDKVFFAWLFCDAITRDMR